MKPTIASLQKQIEALNKTALYADGHIAAAREERDKAREELHQLRQERRTEHKQAEDALNSERLARENAESIYDQHRSAVLHYFMAASNPETARDTKRLVELQGLVVGLVPPRSVECRQKQPWEM